MKKFLVFLSAIIGIVISLILVISIVGIIWLDNYTDLLFRIASTSGLVLIVRHIVFRFTEEDLVN